MTFLQLFLNYFVCLIEFKVFQREEKNQVFILLEIFNNLTILVCFPKNSNIFNKKKKMKKENN